MKKRPPHPTRIRFRLMPVTIAFLSLLFLVKIADFIRGTNQLSAILIAGEASAVTKEEGEKPEEKGKEEEKPASEEEAEKKKDGHGEPVSEAASEAAGEEHGRAKKKDKKEKEEKKDEDPTASLAPGKKKDFTPIELDLLQSLAVRRDELKKWEDDIRMKENLLEATEARINKKIEEIKVLEGKVRVLLEEYSTVEDAKIKSLVKIYENMKPKDAAKIFNELEMPILLQVADKMSERKAAPVLAAMDPMKAKNLTIELAEQRKLMDNSQRTLGQAAR